MPKRTNLGGIRVVDVKTPKGTQSLTLAKKIDLKELRILKNAFSCGCMCTPESSSSLLSTVG